MTPCRAEPATTSFLNTNNTKMPPLKRKERWTRKTELWSKTGNSVTWKHLSISIMQKSRFRNLHDANEYFKKENLEPTTWPIFHTPCSETEVTHLLHSITVSVHLLLLLSLHSIESHPNPQTPFLTLLWFNIEFLFMWIKAISSQKWEKAGDLQNKNNIFSNKIKLLMIYLREKDCTSK